MCGSTGANTVESGATGPLNHVTARQRNRRTDAWVIVNEEARALLIEGWVYCEKLVRIDERDLQPPNDHRCYQLRNFGRALDRESKNFDSPASISIVSLLRSKCHG